MHSAVQLIVRVPVTHLFILFVSNSVSLISNTSAVPLSSVATLSAALQLIRAHKPHNSRTDKRTVNLQHVH
jgi:hypothetical protein